MRVNVTDPLNTDSFYMQGLQGLNSVLLEFGIIIIIGILILLDKGLSKQQARIMIGFKWL